MLEREAMAVLVSARGVSWSVREAALREAGSAEAVLADPEAFADKLGEGGVSAVREAVSKMDALLEQLRALELTLLLREDREYPPLLKDTSRPPQLLFVQGETDLSEGKTLAVVGTRKATSYGLHYARAFAAEAAAAGLTIVSGMALGIDAAGHRGALDADGKTIAVLGGGHARLYPEENLGLYRQILRSGGSVISEYPPDREVQSETFLERNRIIAGMSRGTFVVEGGFRSGASRTAREALDAGRIVFALPGGIDRQESLLPNRLIREGAFPVLRGSDLLEGLEVPIPAGSKTHAKTPKASGAAAEKAAPKRRKRPEGLGEREGLVYDALLEGERDFDGLCESTGIPADALGGILTLLEIDGLVRPAGGTYWQLAE